jgi:MHS family proline/betaine transporter-like MFS transporter
MRRRPPDLPPGASSPRRALVAGGVGNVVEWYDFAVYGAFATIIAATFFPGGDRFAGLSASFAVFAAAFLARPVGPWCSAGWATGSAGARCWWSSSC